MRIFFYIMLRHDGARAIRGKSILIMTLTSILLTMTVLHVAATGYPQHKISLSVKEAPLTMVLKQINRQTGYTFAYNRKIFTGRERVSLQLKDAPLPDALSSCFAGLPYDFRFVDKIIVISAAPQVPEGQQGSPLPAFQDISGTVSNEAGQPLPGASVLIKLSRKGTTTDAKGRFELPGSLVNEQTILVCSYIGYETREIPVGNQTVFTIQLQAAAGKTEETVVIGYGSVRKVDLTGSVSTVQGSDLVKVSGGTAATAFAGRMPGVMVTQGSGEPGAGAAIKIRGIGSLNSNNNPLVLIDGFQGDLASVAPAEVESISVLKDAASAAIYGSRAANGVILITTKKGRRDQPLKISVTSQQGTQQSVKVPKLLSTQQWIEKENKMGTAFWQPGTPTDPALQTRDFDWMGYVFRNAPVSDYNINASGGSGKLTYAFNGGWFDQQGIVIGERYQRANFRSNMDYTSTKFSLGANLAFFKTWNASTVDRSFVLQDIFRTPPTIPSTNPDGTIADARRGFTGEATEGTTPAMDAAARNSHGRSDVTTLNLYGEVALAKGLKFKSVLNLRTYDGYGEIFINMYQSYRPDSTKGRGNNTARFNNGDFNSFVWESQQLLSYTFNRGRHHFDMLAGASAQKEKYNGFSAARNGYSRNDLVSLDAGANLEGAGGSQGNNGLISQFGRVNYSFRSRYLLQANIRRDGSSVFSPGNRFGVFPSASAAWKISEEDFMKRFTALDNLKLRAGYGSLGNSGIPGFRWLGLMDFQRYVFNNAVVSTAQQSGLYNPDISWEKTTTFNLGLDLGLWHRLTLTAEVFNRRTSDMLVELPVPQTSGGGLNPFYNLGAVSNRGWELSAAYNDRAGALSYSIGFNISHVKNRVDALANEVTYVDRFYQNAIYARTTVGQAIGSYYGYIVDGIWNKADEAARYVVLAGGTAAGDFHYRDIDRNDTIDFRDRTFLGTPFPQYSYGGNISLDWKGFDFSVFVQGIAKRKLFVTPEYGMDLNRYYYSNIYKEVYDNTWTPDRQNVKYPKLGSVSNSGMNTTWLQDASYLRVKNVTLGYTVPKDLITRLHISQLRVFASATNLFTFSRYVGFDPEMDRDLTTGGAEYPQSRTMAAGINIVF